MYPSQIFIHPFQPTGKGILGPYTFASVVIPSDSCKYILMKSSDMMQ